MKLSLRLFAFAVLFAVANLSCRAAVHHAAVATATIYSYTVTGSTSVSIHMTKITNATILNSLVTSGSVTGVQTSDLDIAFSTDGTELDVINKNTLTPLFTLAKTGTSGGTTSTILSGSVLRKITFRETLMDFEIKLPQMSVFQTGVLLNATVIHTGVLTSLSESFSGGNNLTGGTQQIIGRFRATPKTYNY